MSIFKCKMCGGELHINPGESVAVCEYCGTTQTLPKLDDDRRANLYDRANHFRRNNDFDKAAGIYEQILNEDKTDAEAYWSLVLCRYGIEYVEDPATHKRVPTVNRAQYTSVFDDEDYKAAIQYADAGQRVVYEAEAKAINEIQKGILEISQKEEPFDVFICYKETDANGRRTPDSVLATDLYHQLTQEGFKVFFSRITLEDKLGTAYEPYIFAALNSAKVMVVLGTKPEYFNAVWVKNEWRRYLALIRGGARKVLIPAYRDMDPYDLPEEFSHLQAQDMSKLGFMQDLIRGIKKLTEADKPAVRETVVVQETTANTAPLLKRAFIFLEDGDWNSADEYCEKVLDLDPECAQAYLGKLMAELRVRKVDDLANCEQPFDDRDNYRKVMRFGDTELNEKISRCTEHITARIEEQRKDVIYAEARSKMVGDKISGYEEAIELFRAIPGWKDADKQACVCEKKIGEIKTKTEAERLEEERKAEERRIAARKAANRRKKALLIGTPIVCAFIALIIVLITVIIPKGKYNRANTLIQSGDYAEAAIVFGSLGNYKDARDRCIPLFQLFSDSLSASNHTVALKEDGTVIATGHNVYRECDVSDWTDIVAVSAGFYHTIGLKADGTVVAAGDNKYGQCDVSDWTDIVAVSAGTLHTIGLKSDGTVVSTGYNKRRQCDVSNWTGIVAVSAGYSHTIGLKADGTVVATGYDEYKQCDVLDWVDIVAVSAGRNYTIGLKADGTLVATGNNEYGQCDVLGWVDIVAVSTGRNYTIGLKANGTAVAVGYNECGQCNVLDWVDIVAVSAGYNHTIGLKADGTLVATGSDRNRQCDVSDWTGVGFVNMRLLK